MVQLFKKKSVLAVVIITCVVVVVAMLFGGNNPVTSVVKTAFSPVLNFTANISDSMGNLKDYFIELRVYREENERLNNEIKEIRSENRDVSELMDENERLQSMLDLQSDLKYETQAGRVISYEPNNWYDTIVINKGSNNGISVGDAVISENGIVGKVSQTGIGWSRVSSILNEETAIGVRIIRTGTLAVAEGDRKLSKDKKCRVSFFDKTGNMNPGDIIETTGSAGMYPPEIIVGTITNIQADADGKEYAVIEPAVDFEKLHEVLIVTGVESE